MKSLPLIDKNAFLSIYVSKELIYASLPYAHYDAGRKYVLTDVTDIDLRNDDLNDIDLWYQYFTELEVKFGWNFIKGAKSKGTSLYKVLPFEDEGEGVAGIQLILSEQIVDRGGIVAAIREVMPEIGIKVGDKDSFIESLWLSVSKAGYEDLLYLDLNLKRFDLHRIKKITPTDLKDSTNLKSNQYLVESAKIQWDNELSLIEASTDARFKAFSAVDSESERAVNIWANFVLNPVVRSGYKGLIDSVRAFTTVQLLSIYNSNLKLTADFGSNPSRTMLIVNGDLLDAIDDRSLYIALLDGLQLRGSFDLLVDKSSLVRTLGYKFAQGINSPDFILSQDHILRNGVRVFIPEIPGRDGERKIVFDGSIIDKSVKPVYGLTPSILIENFDKKHKKTILKGKFVKGAYVEGMEEEFEAHFDKEDIVTGIVIDCRFKPVVYGPDYWANASNLSLWFNQ